MTHYCDSQESFNAAIRDAKPGDTIQLAPGNYIMSDHVPPDVEVRGTVVRDGVLPPKSTYVEYWSR